MNTINLLRVDDGRMGGPVCIAERTLQIRGLGRAWNHRLLFVCQAH